MATARASVISPRSATTARAGRTRPISADTVGGNSYLQVVSFDAHGADAYTLLAHSESDDPASPHFADSTRRYAERRWLRVPFDEHEIASDPQLQVTRLTMPAAPDRPRPAAAVR
ncbi:MAG: penicillin acylase family protein [Burkholderia gladioli]